jgi:hypothetical protein
VKEVPKSMLNGRHERMYTTVVAIVVEHNEQSGPVGAVKNHVCRGVYEVAAREAMAGWRFITWSHACLAAEPG